MAVYNYQGGEVNIKVVYYGPGLSGKTTNLEFMYSRLPKESKGKMVSMKTRTDRTLFFDFFPLEVGRIGDLTVRFLLYTVPGQVYYNATRKLVLKGADAVVFVADSSPDRLADDRESLQNLEENLNELGMTLSEMPWVVQYNKRDVPNCLSRELLDAELNTRRAPGFEAVAVTGRGVYETFEAVAKLVFRKLKADLTAREAAEREPARARAHEPINAEVVVQGAKRIGGSETDESETSGYAEEREEEHESVSEFVDQALKEGLAGGADAENLGGNGIGYEEYGHVVELGDAQHEQGPDEMPPRSSGSAERAADGADEDSRARAEAEAQVDEPAGAAVPSRTAAAPRTVTVPVAFSADELQGGVTVTVCFDFKAADDQPNRKAERIHSGD